MPSETIYFPKELHDRLDAETSELKNFSNVVQDYVRKGIEGSA